VELDIRVRVRWLASYTTGNSRRSLSSRS
jgi:hypothetical protein